MCPVLRRRYQTTLRFPGDPVHERHSFTLSTLHFQLSTLHFTLYTLHFTLLFQWGQPWFKLLRRLQKLRRINLFVKSIVLRSSHEPNLRELQSNRFHISAFFLAPRYSHGHIFKHQFHQNFHRVSERVPRPKSEPQEDDSEEVFSHYQLRNPYQFTEFGQCREIFMSALKCISKLKNHNWEGAFSHLN